MTEIPSPSTVAGPLVIGVDAGGTRSRACLAGAPPGAAVLGRGSGGPGNALSVGRAELTRHLSDAVAGALAEALPAHPDARSRVAAAFGGFAGAAVGVGPERGQRLAVSCLRDALAANGITGAAVDAGGDTEVALATAPGAPADGLVLIAGTGAIATRIAGRRRAGVVDGHGWLLGDRGSGFWLGRQAVRLALEALDGRGPWTLLVERVAAHYLPPLAASGPATEPAEPRAGAAGAEPLGPGMDPELRYGLAEAIVTSVYAQAPPRLALLSPVVVEAAAEGDEVATGLLDQAADLLADTVRALRPRPGEPLVTTGGLLGPGGPLLARVTDRLAPCELGVHPVPDGSRGAAALAGTLL